MPLNSFGFLLAFLPLVAIGAHVLHDRGLPRAAQLWVLIASLGFYASGGVSSVPLLLGSIAFNWSIARGFSGARFGPIGRKRLLVFGLVANALVLCTFKYAAVIVERLGSLAGYDVTPPDLGFPLGLSFFTLTQIMYLVDCYQRLVPASSLLNHVTFVSFFPNITAGPLARAKLFTGQIAALGSAIERDERLARGFALLSLGLFKKVVLGDSFARLANAGFANVEALSTTGAWVTSLSYALQIYFDFSGYSDMAFGSARLLGISLVRNFNAPFRATTISDFWQRWHISLSSFITNYLYTPLLRAMGRVTIHKAALAAVLAMSIAGIWHGAAWTFILFSAIHGIALATYQYWKRLKRPLPRPVAVVVTFAFVNLTFILFRAPDVATATSLARRLVPTGTAFGFAGLSQAIGMSELAMISLPVAIGSVAAFAGPTSDEIAERFRPSRRAALAIIALFAFAFVFMYTNTSSPFIYRAF